MPREFPDDAGLDRVTEVVGLLLVRQGLKNIELGIAVFEPADKTDLQALAASVGEFVKGQPITTGYVLYAEINDAGLCKAEPAKQSLLLKASQADPNEMKVLWDLAREFRGYATKNTTDADYVLYADYRFHPQRWEQGFVHFIVCDRQAEWVIVDMQSSHHGDYQSIKPTSKEGCNKILLKRLEGYLR